MATPVIGGIGVTGSGVVGGNAGSGNSGTGNAGNGARDSDTCLWLHNKLGTGPECWPGAGGAGGSGGSASGGSGASISAHLNKDVLLNIKLCFPDLQTAVKLKLILSFLHIPRRNVHEWRNELEEILEVASMDSELWVSMLAEILKPFPSSGMLNTHHLVELDEARHIFGDMVTELKKFVNRHTEPATLPLECHYLNKAALISVVGQQPNPVKHFTLKRKPKSATLRAELLQKSSDVLSNMKKSIAPTVPVRSRGMPRKLTDTTPLKGLPSRWSVNRGGIRIGARPVPPPPVNRKDGGIKLLDIADQPATHTQKKRKRIQELEEQQKKAAAEAEAAATAAAAATTPATPASAPMSVPAATATSQALPEYARGLNNYVMPSTPAASVPSPATPATPLRDSVVTPITPSAAQTSASLPLAKTPHIIIPQTQIVKTSGMESNVTNLSQVANAVTNKSPIIIQPGSKSIIIGQQQKLLITGQPGQKPLLVTAPGGLLGQNILKAGNSVPVILTNSILQHAQNSQGQTILQQGGKTMLLTNVKQLTPGASNVIIQTQQVGNPPGLVLSTTPVGLSNNNANMGDQASTNKVTQPPPNLVPRRSLALTKDQMIEAQDMFKNANKVTRPEKALILGFMAGSRENPCPNLGNIVTIKLSEDHENVLQSDDTYRTMLCETHFQMNYNNGHWMRIKKYKPIEGTTLQTSSNVPQQVS